MRSIYLDYAATTPLAPAAQEAMLPYLADRFADPHSDHVSGRAVGEGLEDARATVAEALGASADELVFTSGATESCNLALRGLIEPVLRRGETPHLVITAVEHAAVAGPARYLQRSGAELTIVPVDARGVVDPDAVIGALSPKTRLVSVVHADDEVGAVQPVADIATRCREEGVLVHVDAAQTLGKEDLRANSLGADLLSVSSHKVYGPKGVGALYVRRGVALEPQVWGGGEEDGLRSGMPNIAGAVGFAAVAKVAEAARHNVVERTRALRDRLAEHLQSAIPDVATFGPEPAGRLPGSLCVALPGVAGDRLLAAAPDVAAKPCGVGDPENPTLSTVLKAVGADPATAAGAIRLAVGWYTDEDEVDAAAESLVDAWRRVAK